MNCCFPALLAFLIASGAPPSSDMAEDPPIDAPSLPQPPVGDSLERPLAERSDPPFREAPWLPLGQSWKYDRALEITFLRVLSDDRIEVSLRPRVAARQRLLRFRNDSRRVASLPPVEARFRGSIAVAVRLQLGEGEPKEFRIRANSRGSTAAVVAPEPVDPDLVGIPFAWVVEIDEVRPAVSRRGRPWAQRRYLVRPRVYMAM